MLTPEQIFVVLFPLILVSDIGMAAKSGSLTTFVQVDVCRWNISVYLVLCMGLLYCKCCHGEVAKHFPLIHQLAVFLFFLDDLLKGATFG